MTKLVGEKVGNRIGPSGATGGYQLGKEPWKVVGGAVDHGLKWDMDQQLKIVVFRASCRAVASLYETKSWELR